ncbi:MAG: histidinol-phosphate aminotransferase family protein [Chloroflexi bacterium]|nr:histidinol-phosphate aminotransferase family protein [Chloroflexota bacterium]
MNGLPKPRDDLTEYEPYRTQQVTAEVRVNSNEWADDNVARGHLDAAELGDLLLNRYPSDGLPLRRELARRWGVREEQLIFGNGSSEVLLDTFLSFAGHGRTVLLFAPTYSQYVRLARISGATVALEQIGLPYDVTAARAGAAMERVRPQVVVFCTPNNPTGNTIDGAVIAEVARHWPETLVVVDEAYAEFVGETHLPLQREHRNIVVTRTFSKARAAAGLRLGVLVADPELAGVYRAVARPFTVNSITLALAERVLQDEAAVGRRTAQARTERTRIFAALRRVPAVEAFPSSANFVLFRVREDAAAVHARFLAQGVLIRDVSSWPGCAGCLRVTVGTPAENDRFIAALDAVFKGEETR